MTRKLIVKHDAVKAKQAARQLEQEKKEKKKAKNAAKRLARQVRSCVTWVCI